jgi:hypothetical protein
MGRTFFWFGFLYANKENERPPRQWLSKSNLDICRIKIDCFILFAMTELSLKPNQIATASSLAMTVRFQNKFGMTCDNEKN